MAAYEAYLITALNDMISELADTPALDATALKEYFDKSPAQIRAAFNAFVVKLGADKDAFDEWKADLEALNLDAGAAASLAAAFATHAARHASGGLDAITPSSIGAAEATHAARHASGGADAITPTAIGAASISNGIVVASQSRVPVSTTKTASFTLAVEDAEKFIPVYSGGGAIVITIPRDAAGTIPYGTAFTFLRIGANAVSFVFTSGLTPYLDKGSSSISGSGSLAVLTRINDTEYSLSCG